MMPTVKNSMMRPSFVNMGQLTSPAISSSDHT